jgi:hypothetical protein
LLLSALMRAPWPGIVPAAVLWGLTGLCGVIYTAIVAWRMKTHTVYKPAFEDWLFNPVLPIAAYAVLVLSAFAAHAYARLALFSVGGVTLLLLLIGIHNACDAVAYHVFVPDLPCVCSREEKAQK